MKKRAAYGIPVLLGVLFCFCYLYRAAGNVAYSDYIRLINAYLPDVGNPEKFFVPDILTRVPITYLGRLINVKLFGYSTIFDMVLGVLSLGLGAAAIAAFAKKQKPSLYLCFLAVILLYFGLDKWEMLTNGTGWVCFLSISGFYWHYLILDRAIQNGHEVKERILLLLLPSLLTIFIAGPYCGSYSALLTAVYITLLGMDYRKYRKVNRLYLAYLAAVLIPLLLYLWSNSTAVYVHRGAVEGSIIEAFTANPLFFVRFLLNSFASAVIGLNQMSGWLSGGRGIYGIWAVYLLGAAVIAFYLYGLNLTWQKGLYKKTIFPLLLMLNGGLNHLLILSARWIFSNETYGMSSRYAIQFQMGIIGIVWTFALAARSCRKMNGNTRPAPVCRVILCGCISCILAGSLYTTAAEWRTAPFRKAFLEKAKEVGLNYRTATDEELDQYLQHDPAEVRKAMKILEDNHLNLFKE